MKETLRSKSLFVFDMDGTIYLGKTVFPFAVSLIRRLRASGRRVLFFTNNASHDPAFYYDKLTGMGFEPRPGEVLTSGDVTISFLKRHRPGAPCYLVGTPALEGQFREAGITLSEEAPIVVTSFDTTLTYRKLEIACRLIRGGAEYLSTHPDFNCPTENGFIPDSGAITAFVTASTGVKPTCFGKPYRTAVEMMCEITGATLPETVIFGDRLYTDIALGRRSGVTAVLVLTGETKRGDAEAAAPEDRPDFTVGSLADVEKALFD